MMWFGLNVNRFETCQFVSASVNGAIDACSEDVTRAGSSLFEQNNDWPLPSLCFQSTSLNLPIAMPLYYVSEKCNYSINFTRKVCLWLKFSQGRHYSL